MAHEILNLNFERVDNRGTFQEILNEGTWQSLIAGNMASDAVMGHHYHKITKIFFYLQKGRAEIRTIEVESGEKDCFELHPKTGVYLNPMESHAIRFLEDSDFIMMKSHKYDPAAPDTYEFTVKD